LVVLAPEIEHHDEFIRLVHGTPPSIHTANYTERIFGASTCLGAQAHRLQLLSDRRRGGRFLLR